MRTLILDCEGRSALACIRSLGARAVPMVLASHNHGAPGFRSRYGQHHHRFVYTNPIENAELYVEQVHSACQSHDIKLILPQSERSLIPLLEHRDTLFSDVSIPVGENAVFQVLQEKSSSHSLFQRHGVRVPGTWSLEDYFHSGFEGTVVVKPDRSITLVNGKLVRGSAKIFRNPEEVRNSTLVRNADCPIIVQEYLEGFGGAVYLLCRHGKTIAWLEQHTLAQQPGPGAVIKAVSGTDFFPLTRQKIQAALDSIGWTGVIMVELRTSGPDEEAAVIDCNPRFWGPTQLSLDSGVDFPWYLYQLANGQDCDFDQDRIRPTGYTWRVGAWYGTMIRRFSPDYDRTPAQWHNRQREHPSNVRFRDLHFRRDDPRPAWPELKSNLLKKLRDRVVSRLSR